MGGRMLELGKVVIVVVHLLGYFLEGTARQFGFLIDCR